MNSETTTETAWTKSQIVIIGGGGAGLAAALTIAENGGDAVVIEKRGVFGGNTTMASVLFGAETPVQKRKQIEVTRDWAFKTAMGYAHWKINPRLVRAFINKTGDTVRWMEERGIEFVDMPDYYPYQEPRVFHFMKGHGSALTRMMVNKCKQMGVKFITETAAEKILTDDEGKIRAVRAEKVEKRFEVPARCVIIATGGYAGNKDMMRKYCPDYSEDLVQFGMPINHGDGFRIATELGAAVEGLGMIQLIGPRTKGSAYVAAIVVEPNTVWLNKKGERFVDESLSFSWPEAGNALARQPDKFCYTLFDDEIRRIFMEEGIQRGWMAYHTGTRMTRLKEELEANRKDSDIKIADSIDEIAAWMGLEPDNLKDSIKRYNDACDKGYDAAFAKDPRFLLPIRKAPFYTLKCYQGFHGTVGGIKINHNMEVVDQKDDPIPGLYAAGSDTGGWEGDTYCLLLSGSTFAFAISSGRIAGENAVEFLNQNKEK
jgi:fumarate reductase flavoprotein subunit